MNENIMKLSTNPPNFGNIVDPCVCGTTGEPIQHTHEYYSNDELGLYVGVWDTDDMIEAAEPYGMDEFMLVLEGQAIIKDNCSNKQTTINAGETFVLPKGYDCQWIQQGYLRKFFFISCNPTEPIPVTPTYNRVVLPEVDRKSLTNDSQLNAATSSNPFRSSKSVALREFINYQSVSGKFQVSSWESTTFESELQPFPRHQLSIVREGSINIVDKQQLHHTFVAGDAFLLLRAPNAART